MSIKKSKNLNNKDETHKKPLCDEINEYIDYLHDLNNLHKINWTKIYCFNYVFIFDNLIYMIYEILDAVSSAKKLIKIKNLDYNFFVSLTYDFVLKIHNLDTIVFHFFGITLKKIHPFFERCERLYFICANKTIFQTCVFLIRKNREINLPDAENLFFNRLHSNNYKCDEINTIPINLSEVFNDKNFFNFLLNSFKTSKNFLNCFIPNKNQINFFDQIKKFNFWENSHDDFDEFFISSFDYGMGTMIKFDNYKQQKDSEKKLSSLPDDSKNKFKPSKELRYRIANSLEQMCLKIIKDKSNIQMKITMKWIAVDSSCVDSIAYDKHNKFIYVKFRNDREYDATNKIYRYPNCSKQEFNDFLKSDSKGQYVYYVLRRIHGNGVRVW